MFKRSKIAMIVAEFLGTGILTLAVLGVSKSNVGIPYFVSIAAGLALAIGVLTLARVSGAVFNPALTVGLWTVGKIRTGKALVYIAAQLLGGYAAYLLFSYLVKTTWPNSGDYDARVLIGEVVGTFIFSFGVAAAMYQKLEGGVKAALIGISLTIGVIAAAAASAGYLNPAVALGGRQWVLGTYVAGPIIGAILGFNLYSMLFAPVEAGAGRKVKAVPEDAPADDEDDDEDVIDEDQDEDTEEVSPPKRKDTKPAAAQTSTKKNHRNKRK